MHHPMSTTCSLSQLRICNAVAKNKSALVALSGFLFFGACTDAASEGRFLLSEASISQVEDAISSGQLSCVDLVSRYLQRIAKLDMQPGSAQPLSAIRQIDATALDQAKALDERFAQSGLVGSLHCVPILVKDNYDVRGLPTTGGAKALADQMPADDAFTIRKLRAAGAVILAKTNMSELAIYPISVNSWTGSVGSAYDSSKDAGGSSSGSAAGLAANFGLAATGTDTCGSNRAPPANNALVGMRGSLGLVSQQGILPTSVTRDAPGPMARSVQDLALMLDVMAGPDSADSHTLDSKRVQPSTYTTFLRADGLLGKRIGVLRSYGGKQVTGRNADVDAVLNQAVADLSAGGATIVFDIDLPSFVATSTTTYYEFHEVLSAYLAAIPSPVVAGYDGLAISSGDTLLGPTKQALVGAKMFNSQMPEYMQLLAQRSMALSYLTAELDAQKLDAIVYSPIDSPSHARGTDPAQDFTCELGASTGMPSINVPAGYSSDSKPLPLSIEFFGRKWDEARLLEIAYAYEQRTKHRRPPSDYAELSP